MAPDLQQQVFDFIAPFQLPDIWGRSKPLCTGFNLRELRLSADEYDLLMNDFFLLFQVDARHYNHLAYFPEDDSLMPKKILQHLGRCLGTTTQIRLRPLTVGLLVTAARAGRWPRQD